MHEQSGIFAAFREYELPWDGPVHLCRGDLKPDFCIGTHGTQGAISPIVCGKGTTALDAKVSALCEALERHSGIFRGDEPRRTACYREIAAEAIHPNALTLFSESQYIDRDEWNRREGRHNWVPERFDEMRSIDWTPVWSLTHQRTRYLPAAYCYFGYHFDRSHDFCRPDSNGNAAGIELDEAIVRGFMELVERECVSIWWYNRLRRPGVELGSFALPYTTALRSFYLMIGRSVEVLDITIHRDMPTFVALSRSEDPPGNDYMFGFGAHFDARLGLLKALTEMNQALPDILSNRNAPCFVSSTKEQTDDSFLIPSETTVATTGRDFPVPITRSSSEDVQTCMNMVRSWGSELLVLDQTRADVGLPVAKVVVPGMRPWWARFAPGRLYTLPVQMGWLSHAKSESELNPDHLIV